MPELPEVETVRRGLNQVTLNQFIKGGEVCLERTVAYPFNAGDFLLGLTQQSLVQWHRRGKYLLGELQNSAGAGGWLGVHLRMTGQLLWLPQAVPLQPHCRIRLFFNGDRELRFIDQRTFGRLWWVPPDQPLENIMPGLAKLGPEPFSSEFSVAYLEAALSKRQRPIKNALLDQALVAGVGNIYADEALFLSGIQPTALCSRLKSKPIQRLHQALQQVLAASIRVGGTTFSDFRSVEGINGNYGGEAWVYNRAGKACRVCGTPIERIKLAGRSAHYCPTCQR
ncbi:DNA-formamidopyrimidine glycosylase [Almyronema epifaneia]|uniref:Formamidopyrimidine-DNA glycosylase n=1 Tax=Almyronema epifaneia S1 TaxID=2991925 RepID=A0ABW6IBD5_9CYAN